MKSTVKRVAVLAPDQESYLTMMGVVDYSKQKGNWNVFVDLETDSHSFKSLVGWKGHGVIAHVGTLAKMQQIKALKLPIVNISSAMKCPGLPRVTTDQAAIGEVAATHLLERGFTRLAYVGVKGLWLSKLRQQGFVQRAKEAGCPCSVFEVQRQSHRLMFWGQHTEPVSEWLKTLQPPVGMMAVYDYMGAAVVPICLQLGLRVPYDVAVIGTDNDLTVCESTAIPLSSVSRDWHRQGYLAAELLDRLMRGEPSPKHDILIPPGPVAQRRSTDVMITDSPNLAKVIFYIQEHLAESFGTKNLVNELGMSRRWLYQCFAKSFGCTPYEYVMRLRIDRAKQLLARLEDMPLRDIVRACGFTNERHLRAAMTRFAGISPSQYRQLARRNRRLGCYWDSDK